MAPVHGMDKLGAPVGNTAAAALAFSGAGKKATSAAAASAPEQKQDVAMSPPPAVEKGNKVAESEEAAGAGAAGAASVAADAAADGDQGKEKGEVAGSPVKGKKGTKKGKRSPKSGKKKKKRKEKRGDGDDSDDDGGLNLGNHISDAAWPEEYEKLKGRLKRLRTRFYKQRRAESAEIKSKKDQYHIPQEWLLEEAKKIRVGLTHLRGLTAQFHMVRRDPNSLRWAEAREWEREYHNRSSASQMFYSVPEVDDPTGETWITLDKQLEEAKARGAHEPVLGDKMRVEIAEMERTLEQLNLVQFVSQVEKEELARLSTEDSIVPQPAQTRAQNRAVFKSQKPRSKALELAHAENIFEFVKYNEPENLVTAIEKRASSSLRRAKLLRESGTRPGAGAGAGRSSGGRKYSLSSAGEKEAAAALEEAKPPRGFGCWALPPKPDPKDRYKKHKDPARARAEKEIVNITRGFGKETCLHIAAGMGHQDCMDILIAKGADVNARTGFDWTPLHYASSFPVSDPKNEDAAIDRLGIVATLIAAGGDVNARIDKGFTDTVANLASCLHCAAAVDNVETCKLLIAAGAIVNAVDANGRTPLATAARGDNENVVDFLMNYREPRMMWFYPGDDEEAERAKAKAEAAAKAAAAGVVPEKKVPDLPLPLSNWRKSKPRPDTPAAADGEPYQKSVNALVAKRDLRDYWYVLLSLCFCRVLKSLLDSQHTHTLACTRTHARARARARAHRLVSARDEIQAMRERKGAPPLIPEDFATPALFRAMGPSLGDLTGRITTPRTNPSTHFIVTTVQLEQVRENDPPSRMERAFYAVHDEYKLLECYKQLVAQEHTQKPPIPRPSMYEYVGEKSTFVIDFKANFPLLVPKHPTMPKQSFVQGVCFHLRRALLSSKIDSLIFEADGHYRMYFPNVVVPRASLFRLHEWVAEKCEEDLRGGGFMWALRTPFAFLSLIGCKDTWPADKGGMGHGLSYEFVGHYDEFGLLIHEPPMAPNRLRMLTSLQRDAHPVKKCAELSTEMTDFIKVLRRERGRRAYTLTL